MKGERLGACQRKTHIIAILAIGPRGLGKVFLFSVYSPCFRWRWVVSARRCAAAVGRVHCYGHYPQVRRVLGYCIAAKRGKDVCVASAALTLSNQGFARQADRRPLFTQACPTKRLHLHRRRSAWRSDFMCSTGELSKSGFTVHNYGADLRGRSATVSRRHLPGIDRHRANRVAA